jgi:LmbE family N-acetylglucosaminyl deacetylase
MKTFCLGDGVRSALFLGAHCDDVEIGCGGTLALLGRSRPDVQVHVAVFSGHAQRAAETRNAVARLLPPKTKLELHLHEFRDGFFPAAWEEVKGKFEALKSVCQPDVIFTHYELDRHQDHRIMSELTWNTFRDNLILEYEIPKWDGDLGRPAVYMPLSQELVEHKITTLLECFGSQSGKRWFTRELFASLMRIRGMECNSPSGYAEAFFVRKLTAAW